MEQQTLHEIANRLGEAEATRRPIPELSLPPTLASPIEMRTRFNGSTRLGRLRRVDRVGRL